MQQQSTPIRPRCTQTMLQRQQQQGQPSEESADSTPEHEVIGEGDDTVLHYSEQ